MEELTFISKSLINEQVNKEYYNKKFHDRNIV